MLINNDGRKIEPKEKPCGRHWEVEAMFMRNYPRAYRDIADALDAEVESQTLTTGSGDVQVDSRCIIDQVAPPIGGSRQALDATLDTPLAKRLQVDERQLLGMILWCVMLSRREDWYWNKQKFVKTVGYMIYARRSVAPAL